MVYVQNGQCGMCVHWGEGADDQPKLLQIRATHEAPDDMVQRCGLAEHAQYNLWVTPTSGCDGFAPAEAQQLHVAPQETEG
jgi:hypothetical protein